MVEVLEEEVSDIMSPLAGVLGLIVSVALMFSTCDINVKSGKHFSIGSKHYQCYEVELETTVRKK